MNDTIKPCPFCGELPDLNDPDTLYPSGIYWRVDETLGMRTYHGHKDRQQSDGQCWTMHCTKQGTGCGAEMHADSRQEAIENWNTRN